MEWCWHLIYSRKTLSKGRPSKIYIDVNWASSELDAFKIFSKSLFMRILNKINLMKQENLTYFFPLFRKIICLKGAEVVFAAVYLMTDFCHLNKNFFVIFAMIPSVPKFISVYAAAGLLEEEVATTKCKKYYPKFSLERFFWQTMMKFQRI